MLSIVTPAYNNAGEVDKLLGSLAEDFRKGNFAEVVVADDGSRDRSIEEAVKKYPFARYVRLEKNSGVAVARNTGARNAKGDIVLFFDSDIVVMPDTIERVKRYFDGNKDAIALVGRSDIRPVNDGFFPRYKAIMFNTWLPKGSTSTVFDSIMGAIRKDVFFECGGFDETIRDATVEYARLGFEITKRHKIAYDPGLVVRIHLKGFRKGLWTDFCSTMKWIGIYSGYGGRLDDNCTTPGQAFGRILGFFTLISLPFAIYFRQWILWLCLFAAYFYANKTFFLLALKEEGPVFLLRAIPTHAMLSVMTVLGGVAGVARVMYKRLFRKKG